MAKNLRKFTTEIEYSAATLNYPSVSWVTSGDTVHYDKTAPPFSGKWLATYSGGTTSSAECNSTSAITSGEITKSGLKSVEIGDCVTSIGQQAFKNCNGLTSIDIPNSVTSIGDNAFQYCYALSSCTIGSGVTSIGNWAFSGCTSLTSCTIGSGVTSIGNWAFDNCNSLTNIDIPNSVTSIGNGAFTSCSGLTSITVEATTPPTIGGYAFYYTNNCPIYVPAVSVNAYKSAWSSYADRIQAYGVNNGGGGGVEPENPEPEDPEF